MEDKKYESIKSKILKLKALAERGYRGEATNAQKLLEKLCQQYGIKLEDVMEEDCEVQKYSIKVGREKIYKTLLVQCFCKVTGKHNMPHWVVDRERIMVEVTPYEAVEIANMFAWHKLNLKEELQKLRETALEAYIQKHQIFSTTETEANNNVKPLTPEERVHRLKVGIIKATLGNKRYPDKKLLE